MVNSILVGPVLGFRGLKENQWHTSALVVTKGNETAPQLTLVTGNVSQTDVGTTLLKTYTDRQVWRFDWAIPLTSEDQVIEYTLNAAAFRYVIPAQNKPLRIAYGSCFDYNHLQDMNKVKDRNAMLKVLQQMHTQKPYHLLFMGGDQIYADLLWEAILPLKKWLGKSLKKRVQEPFTDEMQQLVEQFYFNMYCQKWSQKVQAAVMAQIPTLMMWDDHDIFDGWGSYSPKLQDCAVFKGIFNQAREHFRLFQLQAKDNQDLGRLTLLSSSGYTYAHRIGNTALVALDLRSERSQNQVISLETWNRLQSWMDSELTEQTNSGQTTCKHLLLMSGIPVVNVNLNMLEATVNARPGEQKIEDDLKDQWLSRSHQEERLRLIHRLFSFSKKNGCRVTIVSGDAHTASMGYIQSKRDQSTCDGANVINQLTSSAIVNIPPSSLIIYMMEKLLANKVEELDRDITARLLKFPGTSLRIIGARNWLSLTFDDLHCIWAEWYVEGEITPYTKVIHPIEATSE